MNLRGFKNWKLKLRYGRVRTDFHHYTLLADGEVVSPNAEYGTADAGPAFFGMSAWAYNSDQATDMIRTIGQHVGFACTGKIYVYDTEAEEPPGAEPRGYNLKFTRYERD
jgi:hypothetical protein